MIKRFVERIERTVISSPIVLSSRIEKFPSPGNDAVYLKGTLIFMDSSTLEFSIFAKESANIVHVDKYRFHYMDSAAEFIFRYDNAPHHKELSSFPHHKHLADRVFPSSPVSLSDVLDEISAQLLAR